MLSMPRTSFAGRRWGGELMAAVALLPMTVALAGDIDPRLEQVLQATPADQPVSVLVFLGEQVDLDAISTQMDTERATLRRRHETVVRALQQTARATQGALLARLTELQADGSIRGLQPFWVANCLGVEADKAVIEEIAGRSDVRRVYFNYPIELIEPVSGSADTPGPLGGPEPGVVAVRAPEVWAMGITGAGVLVATLDTGVDGTHPALASRWRGVADPRYADHPEWAWFDPVTHTTFPEAFGSHGTHTMGTVCGGAPGDQVGVAPGAQWIHAAVIDRVGLWETVEDAILAFEWLIDPDGDPSTNWDVPAVCSNSWGIGEWHNVPPYNYPCDPSFWGYLDACEAAGIVILFSAGNEGSDENAVRRPADRATDEYRTCAVAAVDGNNPNWPIAGFSSRGPTSCTPDGTEAIKPDIAAPGVNVRSAMPGGGYGNKDGTSMASPHVNGVVALMREACPDLGPQQILQIVYDTAYDLGQPGEDNDYGYGMIDAYEAVLMAQSMCSGVWIRVVGGVPDLLTPGVGSSFDVRITVLDDEIVPGSELLWFRYDGGEYLNVPLIPTGDDMYEAVLPPPVCGATPEFYVSVEGETAGVVTNPPNAPEDVYTAAVGAWVTLFEDDFETDTGWTVEDDPNLTTGTWERGVPVGGGDRGDPPNDYDGSGQCYVTDNRDGDSDIDDGITWLISPTLDFSSGDAEIHYALWYTNNYGNDPNNDLFITYVSDDDGENWTVAEIIGPASSSGWKTRAFAVGDFVTPNDQVRVRFEASDLNNPSVVEAGIDAFSIARFECTEQLDDCNGNGILDSDDIASGRSQDINGNGIPDECEQGCPEDLNGDLFIDQRDLGILLADWGCTGGECPGDIDGDGNTDQTDLGMLLVLFGQPCP
jgi:subtilisin family serine protease